MSATFILGRARTGKTRRCFEAIVRELRRDPLGPPIYWILPRQATFNAERELTCLGAPDGFCRARVVSFEEFGRDVFQDCGGACIPEVTPSGRRMIIGHLLRRNQNRLSFYSRVARHPGLATELDGAFAELERAGGADLSQVIHELSSRGPADGDLAPLIAKLRDTRLLYEAYVAYLGQERLDPHRRMMQVRASLSRCSFLKRAALYVDGFLDFTESERQILVGAASAGATIEIAMLINPDSPVVADPKLAPDEMSLFRRSEEAYRRLHSAFLAAGVTVGPPVRLAEPRFDSRALREVERSLFHDPAAAAADCDGVTLIEACDREREVNAVAREIRSLLMTGTRLRRIGVLTRDPDKYETLIASAFAEHGIPYFMDRRRPASHHPLSVLVHSLFELALHDWPHEAVMAILRGGLAGVSLHDADGLENYVLTHRIHGSEGWESPEPWSFHRRLLAAEDAAPRAVDESDSADAIRRRLLEAVAPPLALLRRIERQTARDIAAELFRTLERLQVSRTIAGWVAEARIAGDLELAAEHEQVWRNLVELFDQMVDLLGDEPLSADEFRDVLETGLETFDLAIVPPTVDQVIVGQTDRTRTGDFEAVFVLGLVEGEFPHAGSDPSILTDADRRALRGRRIDLEPGMQQRLLDERLPAYVAFTRGSKLLFASRPLSDDEGRAVEPSSFWRRLVDRFPAAWRIRMDDPHTDSCDGISTPRALVTSLIRQIRRGPEPDHPDTVRPALYQWLATRPERDDAVGRMVRQAWPALGCRNEAALAPHVAAALFSSPLHATVAQLETFAACPFQHFARHALGLRRRESERVTARDLGRLYHTILEDSLREVLRRRARGDREVRLEEIADRVIERIAGSFRGELMLGSARNRYLLDRVRRTIARVAAAQRAMMQRGAFRPAHVGVSFGPEADLPPLRVATPGGAELLVSGRIDRVDRAGDGADTAVIDWRLGPTRLAAGMVGHGLSLQLLSHLLVLEASGVALSGRDLEPAAGFYVQLVRRIQEVEHPEECPDPSDPRWHLQIKPRGVFDRRCLPQLDRELESGWSEVVQAYLKKDGALGRGGQGDAVESEGFRALLRLAARKLGEAADGVLAGRIDIAPYRLNEKSPCARCDYVSVCRFDPAVDRYRFLGDEDGGSDDA